jgi:hypothetical protein
MMTARERLDQLLNALTEDQIETVLHFADALRKGRAVVSACEMTEAGAVPGPNGPLDDIVSP